jgi:hemoglobin-like flavoprotein
VSTRPRTGAGAGSTIVDGGIDGCPYPGLPAGTTLGRMTPRQIDIIRTSWAAVEPDGERLSSMFYERLFELDPVLRRLFAKTDMTAQGRIVTQTFKVIAASLDDFDTIVPFIQALGRVHAWYGVRDAHYDTVGAALTWTLDRMPGARFDEETADAWATAYDVLATVMIEAADEEANAAVA